MYRSGLFYLSQTHVLDESRLQLTNYSRPSPTVFETWLPWACNQLNFSTIINIQKTQRTGLRRTRSGNFAAPSHHKTKTLRPKPVDNSADTVDSMAPFGNRDQDQEIKIDILYINRDMVQVKFNNNIFLPPRLFKVITLIADYQRSMSTLIINSGLTASGVYEIGKLLEASRISEVFLDDCCIKEANYYLLLAEGNSLSYLSLSRCGINDEALKRICDTLAYKGTASKTLKILTLSSNDITDVGAGYIAFVLRTNRHLRSINLADNNITDVGSDAIVSILGMFELTFDEMMDYYERRLNYINKRQVLIHRFVNELKLYEVSQATQQAKKKVRPKSKQKVEKSESNRMQELSGSPSSIFTKAKQLATSYLGRQDDPFPLKDIIISGNKVFSCGNLSISNLNLCYNELTISSLDTICEVLYYQLSYKAATGGLVKIRIEGNPLPMCDELQEIDTIMNTYLDSITPLDKGRFQKKRSRITLTS